MVMAYLESKLDERGKLASLISSTLDKCGEKGVDPTPEERSQVEEWTDRVRKLDDEIGKLETVVKSNDRYESIVNRHADAAESRERREVERRETPEVPVITTLGESFTTSPAFTEYRGRGDSARLEVEDIFGLEERAPQLITTDTLHPAPYRWDGLAGPREITPFLELVNRERVGTGSFDYLTWPNAATGVAVVAEGAVKPELEIAPTLDTMSLETYAGWVRISRQALEDVPRVRGQIETRLRAALARALEAAAIEVMTPPALPAPGPIPNAAGIRGAVGVIQAAGYTPNAIALNPADFATLDIDALQYSNNGPTAPGRYWGLAPVAVPSLPVGTAVVGDWKQGVTWFDRGTTDVYLTDSHGDFFVRNTFVILAEARAAFAVTQPAALATVTIAAPEPPAEGGGTATTRTTATK